MKKIIMRDVTTEECDWLDETVGKGTIVYTYPGYTYGCISPGGVAVTKEDNETPFFEIPMNALGEI